MSIIEIPIDTIYESPFQPRKHFAQEEIEELASSIEQYGLLQPLVVRCIESGYELIAGERRLRASKKAGLIHVPAVIKNFEDQVAAKAALIENVQRVDLNPIEMALAFKQLLELFSLTQEELAQKIGKKRSTVANYLRLLTLPKELQKALCEKKLSMGHAKALLSLSDPQKQMRLAKRIMSEHLSVREAEKRGQKKMKECHLLDLEERLREKLKVRAELSHSKRGSGALTLHYQDLDELDALLSFFSLEDV